MWVCMYFTVAHLVLLQTALLNHLIPLLLERDDDQSHKDVDEEEREDHKVNHVENRHLHAVPPTRPHAILCHIGGVLQDPSREKKMGGKRGNLSVLGFYSQND